MRWKSSRLRVTRCQIVINGNRCNKDIWVTDKLPVAAKFPTNTGKATHYGSMEGQDINHCNTRRKLPFELFLFRHGSTG